MTRDEIIEECAKIADKHRGKFYEHNPLGADIGSEIRALKNAAPQGVGSLPQTALPRRNRMDLADEVVMKLIGPVEAVGETNEDARRLANLKILTDLVDSLLGKIEVCATAASRQEASMKKIGMHAQTFLRDVYCREDQGA